MFHFNRIHLASLLLATTVAGTATAADDKSLAANDGLAADLLVNGQPITVNHVSLMAAGIDGGGGKSARQAGSDEVRAAARAELITEEVLAQAARKQGLDKQPDVADQLAYQQRLILSRAYLQDHFEKHPVDDASLRTAYEWKRGNGKLREYHVRQILVGTPEAARDALTALAKGDAFAKVASNLTLDPGGQQNGGDLGWFRPDTFVDHHFSDAVEALKPGEYTKIPVKSRFGWHVIKLEEAPRVVANAPPYDQLDDGSREALRQRTAQAQIEDLTAELTRSAKIAGPGAASGKAGGKAGGSSGGSARSAK